jgi:hypothetical protein
MIIYPILKAHGLRFLKFSDLEHNKGFTGSNYFWSREYRCKVQHDGSISVPCTITMSLRYGSDPGSIQPLEDLLETLVHEITYCWTLGHE